MQINHFRRYVIIVGVVQIELFTNVILLHSRLLDTRIYSAFVKMKIQRTV